MSKIAKKNIVIPKESSKKKEGSNLTITGPKGTKKLTINDKIFSSTLNNSEFQISPLKKDIDKKNYELTKYNKKSNFSIGKLLSFLLVMIITFIALIVIIDTFKTPLYRLVPNLEFFIFNLFETLKDLELFVKDLIK